MNHVTLNEYNTGNKRQSEFEGSVAYKYSIAREKINKAGAVQKHLCNQDTIIQR